MTIDPTLAVGEQPIPVTPTEPTIGAAAAAVPRPIATRRQPGPQTGILNRPPEHVLLVALTLAGADPRTTIDQLRDIVHAELTSDLAPPTEPNVPPAETGELGFEPHHDRAHLTITVGFAASAYDKLGVAPADRPADLIPIPWAALGDTPEIADSGDVALQICADNTYVIEHALRRIEHGLSGQVQIVSAHAGAQRYSSRPGRTAKREGRAWIGFLDGTSNLRPGADDHDKALTFVDPDTVETYPAIPTAEAPPQYGTTSTPLFPADLRPFTGVEPAWTRHGTYLAARVSVTNLTSWDGQTLADQEATIGRHKINGVSLDLDGVADATEDTPPAFAANQDLTQVALDAHVRRANPRGSQADLDRRLFRRGYPLYEGGAPTVRRGLIFLGFGRTLSTQFEFITRGWLNNPDFPHAGVGVDRLRQFDTQVLSGGYYFIPPLDDVRRPWSWHVPAAATAAAPTPDS